MKNLEVKKTPTILKLLIMVVAIFAIMPLTSATEIVIDTSHHHLGDNLKKELTPNHPEGTKTFNLDSVENIEGAELRLVTKSIVPSPTEEFLDKVYLNGMEIGKLNDYIPAQTPDNEEIDIAIPVDPNILKSGTNTLKITSGSNADGSNYDDFEFYEVRLDITKSAVMEKNFEKSRLEQEFIIIMVFAIFLLLTGFIAYEKRSNLKTAYLQGELKKSVIFCVLIAIFIGIPIMFFAIPAIIAVIIAGIIAGILVYLLTYNRVFSGIAIGATSSLLSAIIHLLKLLPLELSVEY